MTWFEYIPNTNPSRTSISNIGHILGMNLKVLFTDLVIDTSGGDYYVSVYLRSLKNKKQNKLAERQRLVSTMKYVWFEKNPRKKVVMNPAKMLDME